MKKPKTKITKPAPKVSGKGIPREHRMMLARGNDQCLGKNAVLMGGRLNPVKPLGERLNITL